MATEVVRWCDLDMAVGERVPAEPVTWAMDGSEYEADLCETHAKALRATMADYIDVSRAMTPKRAHRRSTAPPGPCPDCGCTFGTKQGLATHRFRMHGPGKADKAKPDKAA